MRINKIKNKNRIELINIFSELGYKKGAEIGVRSGGYSEMMCLNIKSLEKLYSVDPWNIVYDDPRSEFEGIKKQEFYFEQAKERLGKYPACEIIKKTSLEAARDIPYESLDFVYIDGAHTFDYVMMDIIEWARRVRRGGIISGDDYKHHDRGNVITPVNTYVDAHYIDVLNIIEPSEDDPYPSPQWWFVKPIKPIRINKKIK